MALGRRGDRRGCDTAALIRAPCHAFPAADIEDLKETISVAQLAEARGIVLKRHAADLIGRCPFREDKTPSLITPTKNLWLCLSACQVGGTASDWVMKAEGVSFRHAVELLPRSKRGRVKGDRSGQIYFFGLSSCSLTLAGRPGGRLRIRTAELLDFGDESIRASQLIALHGGAQKFELSFGNAARYSGVTRSVALISSALTM